MTMRKLWAAMLASTFLLGIAACERKGPLERAGEEVDEAIDTMKRGEESTATKIDDAVDDMRDGVNDAVDELKD
jgi:predicted small lipoprotein YifL